MTAQQTPRATDWTPDDWTILAAIVRRGEGVTVDGSTRWEYQHRDLVVRCKADPAAREALAYRLEGGAKEQAKALRGTGNPLKRPHTVPKPRFSWETVKALLVPDELSPGLTGRREMANALAMLDQWSITPVLTRSNPHPFQPPSDIIVKPESVALKAKNGDTLDAQIGQVWNGKWEWVVTEPHSGLSLGDRTPTKKATLDSARKQAARAPNLQNAKAKTKTEADRENDAADQRLAVLRDWADYTT